MSSYCFSHPTPSSVLPVPWLSWSHIYQVQTASLCSSQVTHPCFQGLYIAFFALSLPTRYLLSHTYFLPPLPAFFFRGTERTCALRKASMKSIQLSSTSLSLRTASQEILANSLNSLKSTLCQAHIPWDHKLNQGMVTAAQAASNLNAFNDILHNGKQHVQQHFTSGHSVQYLNQKIIVNG